MRLECSTNVQQRLKLPLVILLMVSCTVFLSSIAFTCLGKLIYTSIFLTESQINRYAGYEVSGSSCERVPIPSTVEEFYEKYQRISQPVIFTVPGGFQTLGWKTHLWNKEYLTNLIGNLQILVEKASKKGNFGREAGRSFILVRDFLEKSFANYSEVAEDYYLNLQAPYEMGRIMVPPLSLLTEDFGVPSFFLSTPLTAVNLWIGNSDPVKGKKSGIHHDEGDNLYILFKGRKKVKLYSPKDSFKMYPFGYITDIDPTGHHEFCSGPESHWSRTADPSITQHTDDIQAVLLQENFPRLFEAASLECEFKENEMLFLPHGWWHQVTSYETHIAINVWIERVQWGGGGLF